MVLSSDGLGLGSSLSGPRMALKTGSHITEMMSNTTMVKATLGREATIKCVAENLVGQKTVSRPRGTQFDRAQWLRGRKPFMTLEKLSLQQK